jgi:ATP-dependent DNA helicase RecG
MGRCGNGSATRIKTHFETVDFAKYLIVWLLKDRFTEEQLQKLGLNERQVKAVLYMKERGKITNKEYQEINA